MFMNSCTALVPVAPAPDEVVIPMEISGLPEKKHKKIKARYSPLRDKAFDIYVAQGVGRTKQEVCNQLNLPYRTVHRWSVLDKWDARVETESHRTDARAIEALETQEDIHAFRKGLAAGLRALIKRHFDVQPDGTVVPRKVSIKDARHFKEAMDIYERLVGNLSPPDMGRNGKAISATLIIKRN